jgi:uncharacterized membrane protein SpoIIM required for sporulation
MLESFIMITNNRYVLWYLLAGLIVVDVLLFSMGARIFNREELLGRNFDEINLRWFFRAFRQRLVQGDAGSPPKTLAAWYRDSVFPVLRQLRVPALVVVLSVVGTFALGYGIAVVRTDYQLPNMAGAQYEQGLDTLKTLYELGGNGGAVAAVVVQNVRVLLVGMLLAVFTFGVMSVFFTVVPFGILGFMLGQPVVQSLGVGTFFVAIIPHSLIEAPAIIIATAAAVRLGAIITRPPNGMGVWDAWTMALADMIKVFVGVVLPLLILAAVIEVYITPWLVIAAMGG